VKYSKKEDTVFRLVHLLPIGLVLAAASCADSTGPPNDAWPQDGLGAIVGPGVADDALQPLRHKVRMVTPDGEPLFHVTSLASSSGPRLEAYELSFWAVRGREAKVSIDYVGDGQEAGAFLSFRVPADGLERRPDGSHMAWGDSVQITLSIDPTRLLVRYQPAGLVFNPTAPAELEMWYGAVRGDLDGDGDVDEADALIQQGRLGIWYRQKAGQLWYPISSMHDTGREWFKTYLFHFSGYVVSWDK